MQTRQLTITLPSEIASVIEIRAAIDDLRLEEGIEQLLTALARPLVNRKLKQERQRLLQDYVEG